MYFVPFLGREIHAQTVAKNLFPDFWLLDREALLPDSWNASPQGASGRDDHKNCVKGKSEEDWVKTKNKKGAIAP